jgi:signal transduction histidine kinase
MMHAFEAETAFAERARSVSQKETITLDELRREYTHIAQQYSILLNEMTKIMRVGDATQTELRRTRKELFAALQNAETQRKTAERLNEQKTEILSIAAHDLKNPLSSIIGLATMLQQETFPPEEVQSMLAAIESSGERMLELIQNLLSNSALELGKLNPDFMECNLLSIISDVVIANTNRAERKGQSITFRYDDNENATYTIKGDMMLLYEACDNLISNAVKYSPLNSIITVSLGASADMSTKMSADMGAKMSADMGAKMSADAPSTLRLSIHDQGPGLSAEDKEKLFGYFQRLSAQPTGGESSHGVGLAIAKKIIELHHGRIGVESNRDAGVIGATFFIELPVV